MNIIREGGKKLETMNIFIDEKRKKCNDEIKSIDTLAINT